MNTQTQKKYGVPITIVVAGLLISGAVVFSGEEDAASGASVNFRMPSADDHIRGNPDASVAIVEFSDFECPFCAQLHPTLKRIVEENNDVKWIYRHFPLSTIHSRALSAAVASECIARLGGNNAFWTFTDVAFLAQRQLGGSWYNEVASSLGIEAEAFQSCLDDSGIVSDIQTDIDEATGAGGRGTPYVVVVTANGRFIPFSGALSYAQVAGVIEQARNN